MAKHADDIVVDKKDQLEKIEDYCLPDETIRAVFDMKGGGTGFIGITDKRVIFYDKAFMHKKKAMVTIPYGRIHAVSSEDDTGGLIKRGFLASSRLTLHAGNDAFEFEFRGGDKAHRAYAIIMEYLLK
ncbi:MAG: PH domain-containing protein [Dehalococcoidia bacterium]|nr:PH domain-containing protein [Dehalococcoidia bacterium]